MEPITRTEKYLAYLNGDTSTLLPEPITRTDHYLYSLCINGGGSGGGGSEYALVSEAGYSLVLDVNPTTYLMEIKLKNKAGSVISSQEFDFPIETAFTNVYYDKKTHEITFTLQNGTKTEPIDISDIVRGLVPDNRTIAGLDLKDDITVLELANALGLDKISKIDSIKVNGEVLPIEDKSVDIKVPADYLSLSGGTMMGMIRYKNLGFFDHVIELEGDYPGYIGCQSQLQELIASYININNNISPNSGKGGQVDLGVSSEKFRNIYATNGVIQTSDANEKDDMELLTIDQAKAIVLNALPKSYKMKSGTSDRTHFGLISQDVEVMLNKLGWSTLDFAGFIKSPHYDIEEIDEEYEVVLKDGTTETRTKKNRIKTLVPDKFDYSLRYDEFISPIIRVIQDQEERINSLESEVAELKTMVQQLLGV